MTSRTPAGSLAATSAQPAGSLATGLMEEAHRAASAGRRELARQHYESALYLLKRHEECTAASTILRRVGRTYLDDGNFDAGLDCLEAAFAVAQACGDASEMAHTINVIAISHWQRGLVDDARLLYLEAGDIARRAGDQRLVAMVEQNLGVIASTQGDGVAALRHHKQSMELFRSLGSHEELGKQLCNIGLVHTGLGQLDEAEAAYSEASRIAHECGDRWTRLMVEVNRVALLLERRHFAEARGVCDRILLEAGDLHETRLLAETYKHCGVIARETGRFSDAETHLRAAYQQAMQRQDLLLAAEAAKEQAELFLELGRNRETLQALSLSHRLFTQLHSQRELADVRRRLQQLESRFHWLVQQWAQSIESKDAYTLGHCERVADYACGIAGDMGFDETTLFWFRVGALLHDVGKIAVPSEILNKPETLTPAERAVMERHPIVGVELLQDVEFPWDVIPMIRGHHERWDGHGYPDGLAGEQIPLAARILCVADIYDALTSDRPYRRAYEPRAAMQLMASDSGRQFDPEVLKRFLKLMEMETRTAQRAVRVPGADSTYMSRSASVSASPSLR